MRIASPPHCRRQRRSPAGSPTASTARLFTWIWLERVQPKRPRVPNPEVIAVRVADETEKQAMLALDPDIFFTEPHYDGYPAVLIRLPAIDEALLEKVIGDAWRLRAPRRLSD